MDGLSLRKSRGANESFDELTIAMLHDRDAVCASAAGVAPVLGRDERRRPPAARSIDGAMVCVTGSTPDRIAPATCCDPRSEVSARALGEIELR